MARTLSKNPRSPLVELFERLKEGEFQLVWRSEIRDEVVEKLLDKGVDAGRVVELVAELACVVEKEKSMAKPTGDVRVSREALAEIIRAYQTIGDFLETVVDRRDLYQKRFINGLDRALEEVRQKKTGKANSFREFIS